MRRIDRDAWRSAPWGTGQGVTHEIWRMDDGAPGYVARVSVADLVASGPFTPMPGYRRWLAVLDEGDGLTLTCAGRVWRGGRGDAIELDGGDPVHATVGSAARVFNLIARAGVRWTATWAGPGAAIDVPAGTTLVHAIDGTLVIESPSPRRVDVAERAIVVHVTGAAR